MKKFNSKTRIGGLKLQLADRADNYKITIGTGREAYISINKKAYKGSEYIFNKNAASTIYFDSRNGSVTITDVDTD